MRKSHFVFTVKKLDYFLRVFLYRIIMIEEFPPFQSLPTIHTYKHIMRTLGHAKMSVCQYVLSFIYKKKIGSKLNKKLAQECDVINIEKNWS